MNRHLKLVLMPSVAFVMLGAVSCSRIPEYGLDPNDLPRVETSNVTDISHTSAKLTGGMANYYDFVDATADMPESGFMYGETQDTPNRIVCNRIEYASSFSITVSDLVPSTKYYYAAYVKVGENYFYGSTKSFTTLNGELPRFKAAPYTFSTQQTSATITSNLSTSGTPLYVDCGVCYSATNTVPTISDTKKKSSKSYGTGSYDITLSSLEPNTTYYCRSYATSPIGTAYSSTISFSTLNSTLPTFHPFYSSTISDITLTGAQAQFYISSLGEPSMTESGVCYSKTNSLPTIADSKKKSATTSSGYYTVALSGLESSTTYYCRGYATNVAGTTYSDVKSFVTKSKPKVSTYLASPTANSIEVGCSITNPLQLYIEEGGVYWGTSSNPTTKLSIGTLGYSTSKTIAIKLTGLNSSTTYYVKAYATMLDGSMIYGSVVSFKLSNGNSGWIDWGDGKITTIP